MGDGNLFFMWLQMLMLSPLFWLIVGGSSAFYFAFIRDADA